jgi:hypothetical protein
MKRFLYRIVLPAIVLAVVYHFGYSSGRSAGIRSVSVMPMVTSPSVSVPPAPITPVPVTPPVIETSATPPPTVKRIRQTPEGLVVENRPVQALPSVHQSDKVVFRAPNVSGVQSRMSEPVRQSELQPLKSAPAPQVLPHWAKPQTAPQDNDCGCEK